MVEHSEKCTGIQTRAHFQPFDHIFMLKLSSSLVNSFYKRIFPNKNLPFLHIANLLENIVKVDIRFPAFFLRRYNRIFPNKILPFLHIADLPENIVMVNKHTISGSGSSMRIFL